MSSTWNNLATSARWRGVVSFIRNWIGPFDSPQGMVPEELDLLLHAKPFSLPATVREWYVLSANWNQGGLNEWIHPQELTLDDGIVCVLTDVDGITHWGIRVADLDLEDPPVVMEEANYEVANQSFSEFVAAMIVNDHIFFYDAEEQIELKRDAVHTAPMQRIASCWGDILADGPLESATIVMYAYPEDGEVYGRSRTPAGCEMLEQLRRPPESPPPLSRFAKILRFLGIRRSTESRGK